MAEEYHVNGERKKEFAGVYLLYVMINNACSFPVFLEGDNQYLEEILEWLLVKEYVEIKEDREYVPSAKGRKVLEKFMARYSEFLTIFDVYCAVDLQKGEFAFEHYFEFQDDREWRRYLEDERWDDLRVAVAEYKGLDPVEIVFMSFLSEDRFGRDETGWQFDLLLGSVWDEIIEICNNAIRWEDLGYEDEDGTRIRAEDVIEDIIRQGTDLMIRLLKAESRQDDKGVDDSCEGNEDGMKRVETVQYPVEHYYPYYDPFYVSPVWLGLWLL